MLRFAPLAAVLGLCVSVASADDSTLKVKVGDQFPNVPLKAAQIEKLPGKKAGDTVSIADLKGKTVVVFFYPKAADQGLHHRVVRVPRHRQGLPEGRGRPRGQRRRRDAATRSSSTPRSCRTRCCATPT